MQKNLHDKYPRVVAKIVTEITKTGFGIRPVSLRIIKAILKPRNIAINLAARYFIFTNSI